LPIPRARRHASSSSPHRTRKNTFMRFKATPTSHVYLPNTELELDEVTGPILASMHGLEPVDDEARAAVARSEARAAANRAAAATAALRGERR
jgi:hypothetical protein